MAEILVVDDQAHVRKALELLFSVRGFDVRTAAGPEEALAAVRGGSVGLVFQDMNFSEATTTGEEGAALFRALRAADPGLPIVLMTAWTSLEMAVALVKEGAADYIAKPWDDEALLRTARNLLAARASEADGGEVDLCGLVYESARMKSVVDLAVKVARSDVSVLVTGPNGAGKEKIAEIVQANSPRREGPWVKVNVGALPDELLEAELFGAEAGAFTGAKRLRLGRFEAADGGTLFLDEIGNLSPAGQAKLLRVLQTGELQRLGSSQTRRVDARVIAATNVDMREAIGAGRFREDLYYRLAVIELAVPPLAERPEDVLPLARSFLQRFAAEQGQDAAPPLDEGAVEALLAHPWPGNVRELSNAMRRALLVCERGCIGASELGLKPPISSRPPRPSAPGLDAESAAEKARIEDALEEAGFVVAQAASTLGLSRQALYRRMRRLGIELRRGLGGG
ncbi:MAG TPA: sigma-54 dependent transcriptional regulator [Polyangiaceae bacterium LLY-WYZ-15_(1-7)]|nr:sigma-54-dependent Fis family transcriptional regulator [Myxococcales bacterium]MAT29702.1 sigma-54-dependent Fis family transcriptional regulator [Sandaracinus sp.]MBJ74477.1 sigma-54-dependent Fis family transcriptional regulator [Sandaracinus sp.]HJL06836.1 sigma-54 dependent transcriptional regulator [Polyangiaceae bacterium LLY-WYZ-15_(1-7)]HJL12644.1 sigma-54 dependent transcriptional regulator [Polyangiaceae bacterium LLY-WYZ-15_(1-7)]